MIVCRSAAVTVVSKTVQKKSVVMLCCHKLGKVYIGSIVVLGHVSVMDDSEIGYKCLG